VPQSPYTLKTFALIADIANVHDNLDSRNGYIYRYIVLPRCNILTSRYHIHRRCFFVLCCKFNPASLTRGTFRGGSACVHVFTPWASGGVFVRPLYPVNQFFSSSSLAFTLASPSICKQRPINLSNSGMAISLSLFALLHSMAFPFAFSSPSHEVMA
jgi:hypothetical protein